MLPYYQRYEEQKLYYQMDFIYRTNSFYNYNNKKKKESHKSSSSSSATSSMISTTKKSVSRKIRDSNNAPPSYDHTMYIRGKNLRRKSPSYQSREDSSYLQLPDICSNSLASKLLYKYINYIIDCYIRFLNMSILYFFDSMIIERNPCIVD